MRVLVGPSTEDLSELYAAPRTPWLRVNMVATVDGAATGESGKSGSINNAADKLVFDRWREALVDEVVAELAGNRRVAVERLVAVRQVLVDGDHARPPPGDAAPATRSTTSASLGASVCSTIGTPAALLCTTSSSASR